VLLSELPGHPKIIIILSELPNYPKSIMMLSELPDYPKNIMMLSELPDYPKSIMMLSELPDYPKSSLHICSSAPQCPLQFLEHPSITLMTALLICPTNCTCEINELPVCYYPKYLTIRKSVYMDAV
jgi:hypothetical protein